MFQSIYDWLPNGKHRSVSSLWSNSRVLCRICCGFKRGYHYNSLQFVKFVIRSLFQCKRKQVFNHPSFLHRSTLVEWLSSDWMCGSCVVTRLGYTGNRNVLLQGQGFQLQIYLFDQWSPKNCAKMKKLD